MSEPAVRNNTTLSRYELDVDGHLAAARYELAGGVVTFTSTDIPTELDRRDVAMRLIKGALDDVRASGHQVETLCTFVKVYIETHTEYADLLADQEY